MQRTRIGLTLLLASLALALPARAVADASFDERVRAAMAPYYAALLTSARGDHEGTLRHLFVFRQRWNAVRAVPASARPRWAADAPLLERVSGKIEEARRRAVARNRTASHAELESIRALLRDARSRAGARAFDDVVTDYHEAMERLTGRAGLHNEIALNNDDYTAIQAHVATAAAAWAEIESSHIPAVRNGSWTGVKGATAKALALLRGAAAARNAAETQSAAETLKARYYELLAILSRA